MIAALVSQPFRMDHCVSFLVGEAGPSLIITSKPARVRQADLAARIEVLVVPGGLDTTRTGLKLRARARFLTWSRSGSALGHVVEKTARRIVGLGTQRPTFVDPIPRKPVPDPAWLKIRSDALITVMSTRHEDVPFEKVVVFDLFDLPAALTFADPLGIPVLVR